MRRKFISAGRHKVGGLALFVGLLMVLLLLLVQQPAHALESVREQEIAQCLPGEITTWGDGRDQPAVAPKLIFAYDHSSAPAWFPEALVLASLKQAGAAWSACGVPASVVSLAPGAVWPGGAVRVQWSDKDSLGNFGLANFTQRKLSLSPAMFLLLKTRNPVHPAAQTLQMVISHEMGHLFGLMAHSRRCVDVTSYYDNGRGEQCYARDRSQLKTVVEYRSALPTACDIQRCRSANNVR